MGKSNHLVKYHQSYNVFDDNLRIMNNVFFLKYLGEVNNIQTNINYSYCSFTSDNINISFNISVLDEFTLSTFNFINYIRVGVVL